MATTQRHGNGSSCSASTVSGDGDPKFRISTVARCRPSIAREGVVRHSRLASWSASTPVGNWVRLGSKVTQAER